MRAKTYAVLEMAVEQGVEYGWNRAHKHDDSPSPETIKETIKDAVVGSIYEWFEFEEINVQ